MGAFLVQHVRPPAAMLRVEVVASLEAAAAIVSPLATETARARGYLDHRDFSGPDPMAGPMVESGGRLTLADGTFVSWEPRAWVRLASEAAPEEVRHVEGAWPQRHLEAHRRAVLAAWNEKHGVAVGGVGPSPYDLTDAEQRAHVREAFRRGRG